MRPTFYEFFAGGGMARAGLGENWQCVFANDIDPKKTSSYAANWGDSVLKCADIHDLKPRDLPCRADLAWASFPCQDLSLAGNGAGLNGDRSSAFWGFHDLIYSLKLKGRAPALLVLENVGGTITSKQGRDFQLICRTLKNLEYVFGAMILDAVHFVPQSRPRLFIVAVRALLDRRARSFVDEPSQLWTTQGLRTTFSRLRPDLRQAWRWWYLPEPSEPRRIRLSDIVLDEPPDVSWHTREETRYLLSLMSPTNWAKVTAAMRENRKVVGTIYKRTRAEKARNKIQRAEVRFDDISGCLRTPVGGSSRQTLIVVQGENIRTRLLSTREAARLMGLPDTYKLPTKYNDAYHLVGDGLAVPVVSHLSKHLLEPLLDEIRVPALAVAE